MVSQPLPYLPMTLRFGSADSVRSLIGSKPMIAASQSLSSAIVSSSPMRWPASLNFAFGYALITSCRMAGWRQT